MNKPFIVAISGGSGSGKSRVCESLKDSFSEGQVDIFALDNYYRPIEEQPRDIHGEANFDTPDSFNLVNLRNDLEKIRSGESIQIPKYEYNIDRKGKKPLIEIKAAPIVLFEGIFTCYFQELQDLIDLKIFVDAPIWLMMKRRIERDEHSRGYGDLQETMDRYQNHVVPAFEKYIAPLRNEADLVIPNHSHFKKGVEVVQTYLHSKVNP